MNVCLNMIVKDEAHVIERCLDSAIPIINSWCIVDTGSIDKTRDLIARKLMHLPGKIHGRPWVNFGHNRTEAVELAAKQKPDYILFIDADEVFQYTKGFRWGELGGMAYELPVSYAGTRYVRTALVSTKTKWKWKGVVHEFLESEEKVNMLTLTEPTIFVRHDGARAKDKNTYKKDILLLRAGLKAEPDNARYAFYLAQSYRDAGMLADALRFYRKRTKMLGWYEETWYAKYEEANMLNRLGSDKCVNVYLEAYNLRPLRAEPLYQLARYFRAKNQFTLAYMAAQEGINIPLSKDRLFVDEAVYNWRLKDELAIAAYYVGNKALGLRLNHELLGTAPLEERPRITKNLEFCITPHPSVPSVPSVPSHP